MERDEDVECRLRLQVQVRRRRYRGLDLQRRQCSQFQLRLKGSALGLLYDLAEALRSRHEVKKTLQTAMFQRVHKARHPHASPLLWSSYREALSRPENHVKDARRRKRRKNRWTSHYIIKAVAHRRFLYMASKSSLLPPPTRSEHNHLTTGVVALLRCHAPLPLFLPGRDSVYLAKALARAFLQLTF